MKRTNWYPASIKPVRNGMYEWKCVVGTDDRVKKYEWRNGWTIFSEFRPMYKCQFCLWRGLAEKPKGQK